MPAGPEKEAEKAPRHPASSSPWQPSIPELPIPWLSLPKETDRGDANLNVGLSFFQKNLS